MGLDVSHGCWNGAYSSFSRWRTAVAAAAGIDLDAMEGFYGSRPWTPFAQDPITVLLNHSDCDGEIAANDCGPLADRLESLIDALPSDERIRSQTNQFIDGLRLAAAANEPVEFC